MMKWLKSLLSKDKYVEIDLIPYDKLEQFYFESWAAARVNDLEWHVQSAIQAYSFDPPEKIRAFVTETHERMQLIAKDPLVEKHKGEVRHIALDNSEEHAIRGFFIKGKTGTIAKLGVAEHLQRRGLALRMTQKMLDLHPEIENWEVTGRSPEGLIFWSKMESLGFDITTPSGLDQADGFEYWYIYDLLNLQSIRDEDAKVPYLYSDPFFKSVLTELGCIENGDLSDDTRDLISDDDDPNRPIVVRGMVVVEGYERLLRMRLDWTDICRVIQLNPFTE